MPPVPPPGKRYDTIPAVDGAVNVNREVPLVFVADSNVPAPPCSTTSPAVPLPAPIVVAEVPELFMVVVPVTPVVPSIVFVELLLPMPIVVVLAVPKFTVPAPLVFKVNIPVPLARTVRAVLVVLALMTGFAPANVKAVELKVLVLYVPDAEILPVKVSPPDPLWIVVSDVPVMEPTVVL